MAKSSKSLMVQNETLEINIPEGHTGAMGIEYGPYGDDGVTVADGTVVIEGTISGLAWYPLNITKNDDTVVANLAAPAVGWADVVSWDRVRARRSTATTAQGVKVWLSFGAP